MDERTIDAVSEATPHELIWLGIDGPASEAGHLIPFAFLLTDPESVWQCYISDFGGELGLESEVSVAVSETLEMLVHYLCDEDRPQVSDIDIIERYLAGPSVVRTISHADHALDGVGEKRLLVNESGRLLMTFLQARTDISLSMSDVLNRLNQGDKMDVTERPRCAAGA